MKTNEILAPASWRCVDFISDIHLHPSLPENASAWARFLQSSEADAIFILGDLFDAWIGDDLLADSENSSSENSPQAFDFERECVAHLRASSMQRSLYFMHGNRDFLIGPRFAEASGLSLLDDPSVLEFGGVRYLLSHGDELCWADTAYQAFRRTVRDPAWQTQFQSTSLAQRMAQAREMRARSEAFKANLKAQGQPWIDIDESAAVAWMNAQRCQHFIHGHTHEGRDHRIATQQGQGVRHVLPDWHMERSPPHGFALRLRLQPEGEPSTEAVAVA